MEPLGFKWVRIGLNDVLLDVEKGILFRGTLYNIVSVDNTLFQDNFLKIKATADLTH